MEFNISGFERAAAWAGALVDQVPFALSQAMNDAAKATRAELVERTWPRHVNVRNQRFLGTALRTEFATKRRLEISIFDRLGHANLALHDRGGRRTPRGSSIAVPESKRGNVAPKRTGRGVPSGLRPSALPNSFRKGDVIYQRVGTYKKAGNVRKDGTRKEGRDGRGLKLMYVLKTSAQVQADVPFHRDFENTMRREVWRAFRPRLDAAMKTRRK